MFLTPDELHDLTGYRQKSAQVVWLRRHRWRFEVTREGFPRVARAYWHKRMVEDAPAPEPASLPRRLDFTLVKGGA